MRRITCDHCGKDADDPIEIVYPVIVEDADEDESCYEEADICSWSCMAEWTISQALAAERA
jgi:hypothetical protein